jgi:HEPN domain-containing protein
LSIARFARGESLPERERLQVARLLLDKAAGDLGAATLLAQDQGQADHVVGLHAQQAVEKAIKAMLASVGTEIPRTHDIVYLVELARELGVTVPEEVATTEWLTPWAGAWRYDEQTAELDRPASLRAAAAAVDWARSELAR